jgi:hypothetical protein
MGWDWVHLVCRPLIGLLYQPRMIDDDDCEAIGGIKIDKGNRSTRRKPAPVPLCPPQIKSHMTWPGIEPGPPRWEAGDYCAMARPKERLSMLLDVCLIASLKSLKCFEFCKIADSALLCLVAWCGCFGMRIPTPCWADLFCMCTDYIYIYIYIYMNIWKTISVALRIVVKHMYKIQQN